MWPLGHPNILSPKQAPWRLGKTQLFAAISTHCGQVQGQKILTGKRLDQKLILKLYLMLYNVIQAKSLQLWPFISYKY